MSETRVLVVGAGAVGQAFGGALHRAGWQVTWLVRPGRGADLPEVFVEHELRLVGTHRTHRTPVRWVDDPSRAEVDLTLWTVPSTALRTPWLPAFLEACGHLPAVMLQPGVEERRVVESLRPDLRLTQGLISLIAYEAPLPGEEGRFATAGLGRWSPALAPSPLAGPDAQRVARALRAGGLPARAVDDVSAASQWGTVVTVALVASLEAAGWRFDEVRPGELSAAIDEAVRVLEGHLGARRPLALRAVGPLAVRLVRAGARLPLVPLDLQTYLQVHFTKVGAQTRQHLGDLLAWSEAEGVAVPRLRELHDVLQASTLTSP